LKPNLCTACTDHLPSIELVVQLTLKTLWWRLNLFFLMSNVEQLFHKIYIYVCAFSKTRRLLFDQQYVHAISSEKLTWSSSIVRFAACWCRTLQEKVQVATGQTDKQL